AAGAALAPPSPSVGGGPRPAPAGAPPSRLALKAAARRGYDISGLRTRPVVGADIARFDHVLAMDRGHLADLRRLAPRGFAERPRMFAALDVADPYGGTERDYERALDAIEAGCRDLLGALTLLHAPLPL